MSVFPVSPMTAASLSQTIGKAAGSGGMNPLMIAQVGAGALDAVGRMQEAQMKKRQYNLDKYAGNRAESQQFVDAYNAQQRRAGQTATKSALLQQMAQRLGLNIPMGVSRELLLKPMSGTTNVEQQMKNYYGMGAKPTTPRPRGNSVMDLIASRIGGR